MARKKTEPTDADYVAAASNNYGSGTTLHDGDIDFDDEPKVSASDDGAYVQAWVWVSKEEALKQD